MEYTRSQTEIKITSIGWLPHQRDAIKADRLIAEALAKLPGAG
ncbi:hypothetical protein [Exilibacterium tricleocarpae]|nr:hypothetical protein [Exilibacterium tricleocarpae]